MIPIENILWLELLLPSTEVKNLYLCKEFAPGIAAALQQRDLEEHVAARVTEVLPSLQNIVVEGGLHPWEPLQKNIKELIVVRQLSSLLPYLSRVEEEEEEEEETVLLCMHSTPASAGHETNIWLCAQRKY